MDQFDNRVRSIPPRGSTRLPGTAGWPSWKGGSTVPIASAEPVVPRLAGYSSLMSSAASFQAKRGAADTPVIRTGPSLKATAGGWRTVLADLTQARRILPVTPERQSERPPIAMTTAMQELMRVQSEVQALAAVRMSRQQFAHFESGDYLYDQCPMIREGQWYGLESGYWTPKLGRRARLNASGELVPGPGPGASGAGTSTLRCDRAVGSNSSVQRISVGGLADRYLSQFRSRNHGEGRELQWAILAHGAVLITVSCQGLGPVDDAWRFAFYCRNTLALPLTHTECGAQANSGTPPICLVFHPTRATPSAIGASI